ncbi:hypothetical protein CLOP_g1394, partial [Closterium sp. NIES-67]
LQSSWAVSDGNEKIDGTSFRAARAWPFHPHSRTFLPPSHTQSFFFLHSSISQLPPHLQQFYSSVLAKAIP